MSAVCKGSSGKNPACAYIIEEIDAIVVNMKLFTLGLMLQRLGG